MTSTKERVRKTVFAKLKGLRRKLHSYGVPCTYARSVLLHANGDSGFTITYRLADDQMDLLPQISVRTAERTQSFDHLTFDQGLARLKELFQAGGGTNGHGGDTRERATHDSIGGVADPENQTACSQEGDGN